MTSLAPLVYLVAPGVIFTVAVAILGTVEHVRRERRARRQRATVRELNARRWIFAQQIGATGGSRRVSCEDRWGRAA